MSIIYLGSNCYSLLRLGWNAKLVTNERRTTRLNRIVVSNRMDRPYLVIVDEHSVSVHRAIRKAMRPLVQLSIGFDKAAVIDLLAIRVGDRKLRPRLIQIAHLWNQRMADIFILNDNHRLHDIIWRKIERRRTQWCNQLVI